MSRFQVKTTDFESTSLSKGMIQNLLKKLFRQIPILYIKTFLAKMQMNKMHLNYRLITIRDDYAIIIRRKKSISVNFCIGYPFPIYMKNKKLPKESDFEVNYHIRGESLRKLQKQHLLSELKSYGYFIKEKSYSKKINFQSEIYDFLKKNYPKILFYFDHYRFLGDSFLSTYMLDTYKREFKINDAVIYSNNDKLLSGFYKTKNINDTLGLSDTGIYVFSDLLDIDDAFVKNIVKNTSLNGLFIISSRNYYLVKNGTDVKIHTLKNHKDVLLTNDNIFDYMQKCIKPFVKNDELNETGDIKPINKTKSVYINPFSSMDEKNLSAIEIKDIILIIKRSMPGAQIFIPYGYNAETKIASKSLAKSINATRLQDNGIYDLFNHHAIDLLITVDSALTHIATKLGIFNIVLYKDGFWDNRSMQSMSAESPIAFCSQMIHQFPLIMENANNNYLNNLSNILHVLDSQIDKPNIKENFNTENLKLSDKHKADEIYKNISTPHKLQRIIDLRRKVLDS